MVKRKDQSRLAVSTVAFVASTLLALTAGAGVARASGTPAGSLSPGSLTFADEAIGGTSAPQAISATNSGTASLFFNNVSLGGPDTLDFTIVTDHCIGSTIAVGRSCSIAVTFSPTTSGTRTASVIFTDNAPDSPQTAAVNSLKKHAAPGGILERRLDRVLSSTKGIYGAPPDFWAALA